MKVCVCIDNMLFSEVDVLMEHVRVVVIFGMDVVLLECAIGVGYVILCCEFGQCGGMKRVIEVVVEFSERHGGELSCC